MAMEVGAQVNYNCSFLAKDRARHQETQIEKEQEKERTMEENLAVKEGKRGEKVTSSLINQNGFKKFECPVKLTCHRQRGK